MTLKVLELFGGIGACSKALRKSGVDFEIVDYVELDKYAVASFNAIHGTNFETQDIREWDKTVGVDLIMHGSPCQDFSVAGKQAGGDNGSGTRSSLMYETLRIVEKIKPKYVIWENVKNLLSAKHRHNFNAYLDMMEKLGYVNYYQVLNAKDYGVPQNRERVFTVSIRREKKMSGLSYPDYKFPDPAPSGKRLKDVLDDRVDEKYYLSDKFLQGLEHHNEKHAAKGTGFIWRTRDPNGYASTLRANGALCPTDNTIKVAGRLDIKGQDQIKRVYSPKGISPTLSTMQGGNRQPKIVEKVGQTGTHQKDGVYSPDGLSPTITATTYKQPTQVVEPFIIASRGRGENNEQHLEPNFSGATNTLTSVQKDNYVATPYRVRRLTPKECWRLMGFDDSDFEKAAEVCSNTQLYKQAGNSIVVNVLQAILANLLAEEQ